MRPQRWLGALLGFTLVLVAVPTPRAFPSRGSPAGGTADARMVPDLTISDLEVTQSIQYLHNPVESDNSLHLIRARRTVVRMHVGVAGALGSVAGVDGTLRVFLEGEELFPSPVVPSNGPIEVPVIPDREETDHTLNFTFTVPGLGLVHEGTVSVDFIAEVNPDQTVSESDYTNNTFELNRLFECRRSPSIAYAPIEYLGTLPDPSLIVPGVGDDFLAHTYPIPDPPNYYEGPTLAWDADIGDGGLGDQDKVDLMDALALQRTLMSPVPDMLFGWVPGNPYPGNGAAREGGGVAFGNTETSPNRWQRSFAHEVGHLLGLDHNTDTLAPEVGFDPGFPGGEVTATDDCDLSGTQGTKCRDLKDLMWGGRLTTEAWISGPTHEFIATDPLLQDDCPLDDVDVKAVPFNYVPVLVPDCLLVDCLPCPPGGESCNWGIDPVWELRGPARFTPLDQTGPYRVELRDEQGEVLVGVNFDVDFEIADTGGAVPRVGNALVLPARPDAAMVALVYQGTDVARRVRSPNPPNLAVTAPAPGTELSGKVTVAWTAGDPDGGPLRYSVQYSPDRGRHFMPVATDVQTNSIEFDTAEIAGSRPGTGLIRVIATDGMNTTARGVRSLTVPDRKPPTVLIVDPDAPAITHRSGSPLVLVGYGYDLEDGLLPEKGLVWISSLDGRLGTGRLLQVASLSVGIHRIRLVGTDRDRNIVRRTITVSVTE